MASVTVPVYYYVKHYICVLHTYIFFKTFQNQQRFYLLHTGANYVALLDFSENTRDLTYREQEISRFSTSRSRSRLAHP